MLNTRDDRVVISFQKPASIDELVEIEKANFSGSPLFRLPEELAEFVNNSSYIFVGAYHADKLVGYCAGIGLRDYLSWHPGFKVEDENWPLPDQELPDAIYVRSCECLPRFQKKGVGTKLFLAFIEAARERGFTLLSAHFRNGLSHNTAKKRLAQILVDNPLKDYEGSGETYFFVLGKIS